MKFSWTLLLFVLCAGLAPGTKDKDIPWEKERKLIWEDFRGRPDNSVSYYASTAYAVNCETEWREDTLLFVVQCLMQPGFSWVKKGAENDRLLQHEQLHFDLAELYTRKLRKQISETTVTMKNAGSMLQKLSDKNTREREAAQNRYDKETRHSIDSVKQEEWKTRIETELLQLEKFSPVEVRHVLRR